MRKILVLFISIGLLACNKDAASGLSPIVDGNYLVNDQDGFTKKYHTVLYKSGYPHYTVYSINKAGTKMSVFSAKLNENLSTGQFTLSYANIEQVTTAYTSATRLTFTESPCYLTGETITLGFNSSTQFKPFDESIDKIKQYSVQAYTQTTSCLF